MHSSFSLPSFRTKAPKRPFRCSGLRKLGMLLAPLVVFFIPGRHRVAKQSSINEDQRFRGSPIRFGHRPCKDVGVMMQCGVTMRRRR